MERLLAVSLLLLSVNAFAFSAGDLDVSFTPGDGASDSIDDLAIQSDGKIIIGGFFSSYNGTVRNHIARLNTDGSLDVDFNPGSGTDDDVKAVAIQADGKVIIVGDFISVNDTARNHIARLNADGSLDASFNQNQNGPSWLSTIIQQPDGKIIFGGNFTSMNKHIMRLNPDSSLDTSFNQDGAEFPITTLLQPDGKIIVGGNFVTIYDQQTFAMRFNIMRLNADGTVDAIFNTAGGPDSTVYSSALQSDGKIIIGGDFTSVNGTARNHIARLNVDGSLDPGFDPGSGTNRYVEAVAIQADGKIIIGGNFTSVNGMPRNYIARLNADGAVDLSFNPSTGANSIVGTIAVQADGKIIIGGPFTAVNGVARNHIARIHSGDSDNDGIEDAADWLPSVKNDYTSDGIAGWIWKGQSNGVETVSQIWQLTFPLLSANFGVPNRFYPPPFPDQANWELLTSGDFNKDGDADILWRHNTLATWKVWQMQNGTRVAQNAPADFDLAHEWVVVGAGDTDKDGDDDVILNKISTGEVMIWQMQDHAIAATHNIGTKAGYTLNRIGDFNKDGDVDLLFRQNSADVLITWELQANAFVTERALANTGTDYHPVCAGDFDNDNDDDIMLVNSATTQEKWFVMENYLRTQQFGASNSGFVFKGCGDYDGDGDTDSLWQRSADGVNRVVLQQNWGAIKQTVYTNAFGGVNPGAAGYGFVYRGNSN